MTNAEATQLLASLKVTYSGTRGASRALLAHCLAHDLDVGVDHVTGDWVILDADGIVVARCA